MILLKENTYKITYVGFERLYPEELVILFIMLIILKLMKI